jgi:gliding motility-associated-like protein
MLRNLGIIILLFAGMHLHAQKYHNVWAFGDEGGINFNSDPPTTWKSKSDADKIFYWTTSVCDANGVLKLYTDGNTVWNRDGFKMLKYNNWWPWTDTIMPLFVPHVGNDSLYYLFGICSGLNANKLTYITTKLKNAGDLEEIIYPRPASQSNYFTALTSNASLMLAATAHCNQKDQWVVTQTPGKLEAFLVTENGVSTVPVVSNFPGVIPNGEITGHWSNIKFSANGEKLVLPIASEGRFVVFSFDNQTGSFSNPVEMLMQGQDVMEDLELSPDGNKLYLASWYLKWVDIGEPGPDHHEVWQLDLEAGSPAQIWASKYKVNGLGENVACIRTCILMKRSLQLAPDGKIYMSMRYTGGTPNLDHTISVIEDPNKKGLDCRYRKNFLKQGFQYKWLNYNYVRSGSFSLRENGIQIQKMTCVDRPVQFSLLFNNVDSVKWNFGDPASNGSNTSTQLNPQHLYPGPGTYNAMAIIYRRCMADTAYKQVVINAEAAIRLPAFIQDTLACIGNKFKMNVAVAGATAYAWDNGLIYSERIFDSSGRYYVTVFNNCSMDKKEFSVQYVECPCDVWTPNAFTPNNDGLNDQFKPIVQCEVQEYDLKIFHRWGGLVFQTKDKNKPWTGRTNQNDAPSGVYVWVVRYKNPNNGVESLQKGTVTLIR